jgi:hypothetical protein
MELSLDLDECKSLLSSSILQLHNQPPFFQPVTSLTSIKTGTVPASEAVSINFTRDGKHVFPEPFHPTFTYAILGEEEIIPGFKELNIEIDFRAHDLKPSVKVSSKARMKAINDAMADLMDFEPKLAKFLGEGMNYDFRENG